MTLPSTGPLRFSQIEQEFGQSNTRSIGEYRISKTIGGMSNIPLDEGIGQVSDNQTNNSIRFSQFRGSRLNIVVFYGTSNSGGSNRAVKNAKDKFNNDENLTVIGPAGGVKNKPNNTSGSRVIIHANTQLGSNLTSIKHCALRTGEWNVGTILDINIGSEGFISGAGGKGGEGGSNNGENGENGENGSSAIGIEFPVRKITVQRGGVVRSGGGGGGGGGGVRNDQRQSSGGGGGGGAGIPAGAGGNGGNAGTSEAGENGASGTATDGGNGGGGTTKEENGGGVASGGGGGGGAARNVDAGEGGQVALKTGDDNRDNSQGDPGVDGSIVSGGDGGEGNAEGEPQFEGDPGEGGSNGYRLLSKKSINLNSIILEIDSQATFAGEDGTFSGNFQI